MVWEECLLNKERWRKEEESREKMKACFSVCLVDQIDFPFVEHGADRELIQDGWIS